MSVVVTRKPQAVLFCTHARILFFRPLRLRRMLETFLSCMKAAATECGPDAAEHQHTLTRLLHQPTLDAAECSGQCPRPISRGLANLLKKSKGNFIWSVLFASTSATNPGSSSNVVGIVVGVVVALLVLGVIAVVVVCCIRRKSARKVSSPAQNQKTATTPTYSGAMLQSHDSDHMISLCCFAHHNLASFRSPRKLRLKNSNLKVPATYLSSAQLLCAQF